MSNIHENLQKILHAVWGKDVRQAIHDAIHDCYEDGSAGSTDLIAREEIEELEATKATRIELAEETADRLAEVAVERGRIDNLVTSGTGVTNATKRTETTLFSASVPCFGNVSGYSGYFDIEDAIDNYDYIKIRYSAFGRTGIVDCKPADISASGTIGSTVFHWSEIQPNWDTTSLDNPRTVFRHMDFSAVNISSGNTHRLSIDAVVFGWNGDATSNGKISDSFTISWDSSKSLYVASGFTGGIYSIIGVKYTDAGVDKDTELTDIRTGADGTVYQTAGGAVRGQIEDITNRLDGIESNFSDEYDSTATYAVGDRCVYGGVWYECNTAISTAEEWTEAHWDKVSVADITDQVAQNTADIAENASEISSLKEDLSEESHNLFGFKTAVPVTAKVSNVDVTYFKSSVKFDGTANASGIASWSFGALAQALDAQVGDTLTMSFEVAGGSYSVNNPYLSLANVADTTIRLDQATKKTFVLTSSMTKLQIFYASGTVFDDFEINIQIEKGTVATPFTSYGSRIADDKIARFDIENIKANMAIDALNIAESKSTQLVTGKYTDFEQGTLNASGLPSSATYRLRSIRHIPISVFGKVVFNTGYKLTIYCYAVDFSFLGYTSPLDSTNTADIEAILEQYPTAKYIKFLFYNDEVTTITVADLVTAGFKFYTFLAQDNLYESQVRDGFAYNWVIPYRNIVQMMGSGFSFAIQTDTHYTEGTPKVNFNSLKNLSRMMGFDFIAHLGDIIRGYEYDTTASSIEVYKSAISGLVDGAECSTFVLMGNHDNGCMYATATDDIDNAFLPDELFALFERPTTTLDPKVVWGSRTGLYFYRDFDEVRVVVLNTSDLPYEEVSVSDINVNNLKISSEQAEWFTNVALDTDKAVLVLSHAPLDGTNTITNRTAIVDAMEAFVEGGGTIIANVAGHTHTLNATKTNGINYIVCDNGGDICEVFAVDLDARTIETQQIGKDFTGNRSFTF